MAWRPAGRALDDTSGHADKRRPHSAAAEAPCCCFQRQADCSRSGIDDWPGAKGTVYGTIVVDLERCKVVDVMQERSAAETANWLSEHPETEIVSPRSLRTVCARHAEGAPQARQVADRFHLLQNLRQAIEAQLSRANRSGGRALFALQ
ncbi:transposase [Methylocystis hirsuta]